MDKRSLHYLWTQIRPVRTAYLLAAGLLFAVIGVVGLRSNNLTMVHYRDAVYQADKQDGDVEQALRNLRSYVAAHMNTELSTANGVYPPIQLKYTYERLKRAEQDRVDAINSKVYTDAQKHCEALYPNSFSGGPRVPCITEYVKAHGTTVHNVPDAQYKFDFVSPRWSPDIAGWSLAFSALFLALAALRFALGKWLKNATR